MAPKVKKLLSVIELGGLAELNTIYQTAGYEVIQVNTMRKALAQIKRIKPDIIVAEFIFAPTYGSQLSNFESLLASLQTQAPAAKLIALVNKDDLIHLNRLRDRHPIYAVVDLPLDTSKIKDILKQVVS